MKPSDDLKSKLNLYTGKDAQTIAQIRSETGLGESTVRRHVKDMVTTGKWKAVNVRCGRIIKTAYIKVK